MYKLTQLPFAILFAIFTFMPAHAQTNKIIKLPGYALKHSVETTANKAAIWKHWSDVENWKDFDTLLEYSYLENGQTFKNGATGYLKAETGPKTKFTITELTQGQRLTLALHLPLGQTLELRRYFENTGNGKTIFVHENHFKGPLSPIYYTALKGTFKKELKLVMERLKILAER